MDLFEIKNITFNSPSAYEKNQNICGKFPEQLHISFNQLCHLASQNMNINWENVKFEVPVDHNFS